MLEAKKNKKLYKEQPFVIGIPGNEADGLDKDEQVLIQGIIDAFFYEGDEVVILASEGLLPTMWSKILRGMT